ncbi:MAG TPA: polysaccharide deacetylase family protein [Ktedonobacterales bacterium]
MEHWRALFSARLSRSLATLLLALLVAGCGATSTASRPTPTPQNTPTSTATAIPTATATAIPTATPTPRPTATPRPTPRPTATPRPTPRPTATPSTACIPAPGVQPVSSVAFGSIATSKREVSLTFDSDGGSAGNAASYLDTLGAHDLRVTWFLTGYFARANPSLVLRMLRAGDDIGNHTLDHPDLVSPPHSDSYICTELTQANSIIAGITGRTTRPYFRPPYGSYNTQVRTLAAKLGYRTILWSIDPRDWDSANTAADIERSVLDSSNLRPGAIILMHVNSAHEAEALPVIIEGLEARGYAIVPLSQLMQG